MLLGLVLGLAIYNRVLLDFPLPLALYKKLLNQVGSPAFKPAGNTV
jgi:ubiquitin-protein ligase E3 A